MTKGGFTMPPFLAQAQALWALHLCDLLAQGIVCSRDRKLLDLLVALGLVDGHVKDTKVQLAKVEEGIVDVLSADEVLDHRVRDLFRGGFLAACLLLPGSEVVRRQRGVVLAEGLELGWGPAPVLEHLARCFDEVPDGVGAVETGVDCLGDQVVDTVAEFVEESHDFIVLEQAGLLGGRLGKVAHQCSGWVAAVALRVDETL